MKIDERGERKLAEVESWYKHYKCQLAICVGSYSSQCRRAGHTVLVSGIQFSPPPHSSLFYHPASETPSTTNKKFIMKSPATTT